MPERQDDNNAVWTYPSIMPSMDAKLNPHAVQLPNLVEAVGLDGRFMGALRPFPGMADITVHGVPNPSATSTINTISNIVFAKYVAVNKGTSGANLKGIAYIADNQTGTGQAIYFAYRDSSDNSTDVVMLEDFDQWTDFKLTSVSEFDITALGRYIYLSISGDTTSTVTQWQGKAAPYNKAYFWDFKINAWDKFVTGFDKRFMGLMPRRVLGVPLNEDNDGSFTQDSDQTFAAEVYGPTGHTTPKGEYTYACELVSRKHKLRSFIRLHTASALGTTNSGLRFFVDEINLPVNGASTINQIKGNTHERTCIINWGIPHVDGFRLWRTQVNDIGVDTDKYSPMDSLFQVTDYQEKGTYQTGSGIFQLRFDHDSILGTVFNDAKSPWFTDNALVQQPQFNPFLHEFHPTPRFKRIAAYDGLLVGITDVEEPATPDKDWDDAEKQQEAIAWSTLIADEPENFPPDQQYRPDDAAERFFSLELTGDYLFPVTNASVYKMSRSGGMLGVNRLQFRLGAVSRYGQTGVGNTLFIVTKSGVKQIDGNSGSINSITVMDRIILDDSEWAGTLSSIHVEFDATIGAIVFLNTAKKEVYLLWESTGALTKLEDVPWSFVTSGPDVLTDGSHRAYFVTADGTINTIDGQREMGKRSMCGTSASETMNGTVTTGSNIQTIDSTAVFPANCVGFSVHMLSGALQGEQSLIVTRNSDTTITHSGFSGATAAGDRYSIAPVVTKLTFPVLAGQGGQPDPFVRKIVKNITCSFSDLGGETGSGDINGNYRAGIKQMDIKLGSAEVGFDLIPDKTSVRANFHSTRPFPFLEFKGGNQDWELQAVLVHGILSSSEAQSRQG